MSYVIHDPWERIDALKKQIGRLRASNLELADKLDASDKQVCRLEAENSRLEAENHAMREVAELTYHLDAAGSSYVTSEFGRVKVVYLLVGDVTPYHDSDTCQYLCGACAWQQFLEREGEDGSH